MNTEFLKLTDRLGTHFKSAGPKFDLFFNVASRIYREVYGEHGYEQEDIRKRANEEITVLANACMGISDWAAKKVEIKIVTTIMDEFRPMLNGIDTEWPRDWKNTAYRNLGNMIEYAIRRRANLDNPPSPNLSIVA